MSKYFNLRKEYFDKGLDFLFKTPYNEEVDSFIYQGEMDDYFNSYWFADLDGFIGNHYIRLEPVLPNIELDSFESNLEGYKNNHNKVDKTPIGVEGNGLIVVLDNVSGKVELEDFERGSFEEISDSLDELIASLKLQK
ncbi:TPA: SecY-interacting protein Syd [Bacillus thuringiensis]|nr:SecY-interacting protein Syd [Bacillus thuringiensis]